MFEVHASYPLEQYPAQDRVLEQLLAREYDMGFTDSDNRQLIWFVEEFSEARAIRIRLTAVGVRSTMREATTIRQPKKKRRQ